jgi:hypothetical protein
MVFLWFSFGFPMFMASFSWENHRKSWWTFQQAMELILGGFFAAHLPWEDHATCVGFFSSNHEESIINRGVVNSATIC